MKVLTIFDPRRNMMGPRMVEAVDSLGNVEKYDGYWTGPLDEEVMSIRRREEREGPNVFEVPEDCIKYNDAEVIYTHWVPIGRATIEQMPNLKVIGVIRAGLENIDVEACKEHGVLVINATGHNSNSVAELAVGLMISLTRNIPRLYMNLLNGIWNTPKDQSNIHDFPGMTVGIVGLGAIGSLVARKMHGFDVNLICYDPYVSQERADKLGYGIKMVDFDTLLTTSDFITIHIRLTPETDKMFGAEEFKKMKKSAFFVNVSRSGMVDTAALVEALNTREIAGAAVDVFDNEPIEKDHPLLSCDNVILTPHRAGATYESTYNSPKLVMERLGSLIDGKETAGLVNPEVVETPEFQAWLKKCKEELGR